MAARALAALALLLLAGCAAPPSAEPSAPVAPAPLAVSEAVRVDAAQPAREPSIVALPDGGLIVAGYWGPVRYAEALPPLGAALQAPLLWRSDDAGATWQRLDPGLPSDRALGNSDISLAAAADGTLYVGSLTFNNPANTLVAGASADGGRTWTWSLLQQGPLVDRPWMRVAPGGIAHVVWNDGRAIHHAFSADRGRSWPRAPDLAVEGGDGGFDVGPGGELAVRVVPLRGGGLAPPGSVDGVAVSRDAGATWQLRELPGNRAWPSATGAGGDGTPRAWDPVAFDGGGQLWAAWGEGDALWLARSSDLGASWTTEVLAQREGGTVFDPFLRGGPRVGEVAATWFVNPTGSAAARLAQRLPSGAVRLATLEPDTGSADHGEYFEVAWLAEGGLAAAVPVLRQGAQLLDFRAARAAS
ncbi:MAG TPA: sialidase family protein [Candidatus Thermoplasmatota archaeon]|jgi:hypothetical protein|nr:sialidase family protein [Candidatus Thermoplasmatota archaeon]